MKPNSQFIKKTLFLGTPLVLAMIGFVGLEGENFLQALFQAMSMYLFNYADPPANIFIEIARWLAAVATFSGIVMVISTLRDRLHNFLAYRAGDSTAVYGPQSQVSALMEQLGKHSIHGKEGYVPAQRYILLGSEDENLEFYHQNKAAMAGSTVYLKCHSLHAQSVSDANLRLFCPEETAARLFWKQHCFYDISRQVNHQMRIVFLGFGKLGQEILTSGLQNNLFHPGQQIEYHIFGDDEGYCAVHSQLSAITDPVIFHDEPWSSQIALLDSAQAILVLQQEDQLSLLRQLLLASRSARIYPFSANPAGIELLDGQQRLYPFHWLRETQKLENILGDKLYLRAKRINLRYAKLYSGVEETDENMEKEWKGLNAFTRYSNISSADYHEIQMKILETEGLTSEQALSDHQWLEYLSELEHIRWCRYHYLNNWKYGHPANGKNKDAAARIHVDLVDYQSLTDGEKEKDRENVRLLFSIA